MHVRKMDTSKNDCDLMMNAMKVAFSENLDNMCFACIPKNTEHVLVITNLKSIADTLSQMGAEGIEYDLIFVTETLDKYELSGNVNLVRNN